MPVLVIFLGRSGVYRSSPLSTLKAAIHVKGEVAQPNSEMSAGDVIDEDPEDRRGSM
jgi:hypothetical protein